MQSLKINLSSNNEAFQIHNIKLYNMNKKIIKLQIDFRDLFYNNKEIKNLSVIVHLKEGAQIIQQKRRPIPIHLQDQVVLDLKRLIKHGYVERATEITEDCFVSPAVISVKKDKSIKIALDSRKFNEVTIKRKAQMPNMEELFSRMSRKLSEGKEGEVLATKLPNFSNKVRLRLRVWADQTGRKYKKSLYIYRNRRRLYWILPFPERIQWTGRYTYNFPRTDRHDTRTQTPGMVRRYHHSHQRKYRKTRETRKKLEQAGYRLTPKSANFSRKKLNGLDTKSTNKEYDHYKTN